MSRSSVRAPLLATVSLMLAAGVSPVGAQRSEVATRRSVRVAGDADRELGGLKRKIDSLVRVFEAGDLNASDRLRVGRSIDALIAQFKAQRMRLDASSSPVGMEGPYVRRAPETSYLPRPGEVSTTPRDAMPHEAVARGWIGFVVSGAPKEMRVERNEYLMRFLMYPEILSVDPSSPAQRAGLAPGDTLLAYDGQDVRSSISMTRLLRPNAKVTIRVRRDGRVKDLPVVVGEAPSRIRLRREWEIRDAEKSGMFTMPDAAPVSALAPPAPAPSAARVYPTPMPPGMPSPPPPVTMSLPRAFESSPTGVAGAQLVTISEGMKRSLGLQSGVLVATVPVGTPADESGLKEGDVIVRVDRQPVRTVVHVWQLVTRAAEDGEREVDLDLIREKQARTIKLRW